MVHSKTKHPSAPPANALVSSDRFGCRGGRPGRAPCHAEALRGGGSHFAKAGRLQDLSSANSYFLIRPSYFAIGCGSGRPQDISHSVSIFLCIQSLEAILCPVLIPPRHG